jgi:hypothetical protein
MSTPRPTALAAPTPANGHANGQASACQANGHLANGHSANGRQANGRFARGNPGGPGNPFARQVAALRKVILQRVTADELLAITEALLTRAREGNVAAAKLLLGYAIGKPAATPDPDRLDGEELEHFKEQVETVNEVYDLAKATELAVDPRPKGGGMSTDYALLMNELVSHPEKYDNPFCFEKVQQALEDSDTSQGAKPVWQPPSANGVFGGLPPRIRTLAEALFPAEAADPEAAGGVLPSTNGG